VCSANTFLYALAFPCIAWSSGVGRPVLGVGDLITCSIKRPFLLGMELYKQGAVSKVGRIGVGRRFKCGIWQRVSYYLSNGLHKQPHFHLIGCSSFILYSITAQVTSSHNSANLGGRKQTCNQLRKHCVQPY